MALQVKITRDPSGASELVRLLQVEDYNFGLQRNISLIRIPGDTNMSIDLGISEWDISLSGVCDNSWTNTATGGVANVADFMDMRDWGSTYTVRLTWYSSTAYSDGKIRAISLRREAGTEFWNWTLEFACETFILP